jgi:hypothetical protein
MRRLSLRPTPNWRQCVPSTALLFLVAAVAMPGNDDAVALIASSSGALAVAEPGRPPRQAATLDWLRDGAVVECPAGGKATLALAGGRRYELPSSSRVRVHASDIEPLAGQPRELPAAAPLPRISALTSDSRPGARAGALRVRGRRLRELYPNESGCSLAAATTLTFAALPGVNEYHVEIEDDLGDTVFHATTPASQVRVSPDVLQPGRRYRWSVRGSSAEGLARGEAEFWTLDADAASRRERLHASLADDDASSLALLAEVDRGLGLLGAARDGFAAALAKAPTDAALQRALADVEARLREPSRAE